MTAALRLTAHLPRPSLIWPIAAAWLLAIVAEATGHGAVLHHDTLIEGGRFPLWLAFVLFLLGWQVMIAAMMLPSSLPLIRLFQRAAVSQPRAGVAEAAFLGGYVMVWTVFGTLAFLGDVQVHRTVDRLPWLHDRPELIGGAVLLMAGAFQFSGLKEKCLDQCRHPGAYLLRHYRRGVRAAFRLGRGHGLFCLGCCWALMLVSFAAGIANLIWMATLTLLMLFEKTGKGGNRGVAPIGFGLVALGVLQLLDPSWLPPLFAAH
jgi:predicted metal-binding membrane protein